MGNSIDDNSHHELKLNISKRVSDGWREREGDRERTFEFFEPDP